MADEDQWDEEDGEDGALSLRDLQQSLEESEEGKSLVAEELSTPAEDDCAPDSAVEQELWRIFTFYALHNDAMYPEVMRIANFVRFARDCQLVSPKLTSTQIELEIVRLARSRKVETLGDALGVTIEGNHTIALDFSDFLALLDAMALKVYPMPPGGEEVSIRRLLLENVLLLACRREKLVFPSSQGGDPSTDPAARAVIAVQYGKVLGNIFRYYADRADKRRGIEASQEASRRGLASGDRGLGGSGAAKHARRTRELQRSRRETIGYPEYVQFCTDFTLRSTSLLTAIQVGELYLSTVSLDPSTRRLSGMTVELFHSLLLSMAVLAYRGCHASVTPASKAKALLNYMWRGVNCNEKVDKAALADRASAAVSHAGSLNVFGSGPFSDFFLAQWTAEGYPDYSSPLEQRKPDGAVVLRHIVTDSGLRQGRSANNSINQGNGLGSGPPPPPPPPPSMSSGQGQEESKEGREDELGSALDDAPPPAPAEAEALQQLQQQQQQQQQAAASSGPRVLHGFQLAALFRMRPELSELAFLEIRNMEAARRYEGKG